jgi:hypothetical protein
MKKIKPSDLRQEADAMIRDGSMPSLEAVLQAVAGARQKYAQQIKTSRKRGSSLREGEDAGRVGNATGPGKDTKFS